MKSWGTITQHLGNGVFEIKPHQGAGVVVAQVLPAPGQSGGIVYDRATIEKLAPKLVGRDVTASLDLSVVGEITKSHVANGMTVVDAVDVHRVEARR